MSDLVYLRPDVKLEPLVARWYAWSHLISPAQLALHLRERLLPLLASFMASPGPHLAAGRDPGLYGGPFVSLTEADAEAVASLHRDTVDRCRGLLSLAADLRPLAVRLQEQARGHALHEFYAQLPPSLQGLVELVYDTHHHADLRLFEALLMQEYPTQELQELMLHRMPEGERPFFMSTPRVPTPDSLFLELDFADDRIDALAAMRCRPSSLADIARRLRIRPAQMPLFERLFTPEAPQVRGGQPPAGDQLRMRFFGHACVLLETADVSVLLDPFVATETAQDGRLTLHDLPDHIDHVVLTHSHHDHFSVEMLLQLRHRIGSIIVPGNHRGALADPSMKLALQSLGFERIQVLEPFETVALPEGSIQSLPFTGEHADLDVASKHAIAVTLKSHRSMFLVDSDGRDPVLYQRLVQRLGPVDTLFIGMECVGAPLNWLYEPLLTTPVSHEDNESRRLSGSDCERAWAIINALGPQQVFVYAMGQDPWMKYVMGLEYAPGSLQLVESDRLLERCRGRGLQATRLVSGYEGIL